MSGLALHEHNPIRDTHLAQLRAVTGAGPVLILTHDNPDPDALASGKALATLLDTAWDISSLLVYSGLVARAENQAMLTRLTPEWEHRDTLTGLDRYSALALVDTQPGAGNNRLPATHPPHIVFDHHRPRRETMDLVRYADLRPELGATVTLLHQYFETAGIDPDPILTTAMFYGLKTDTRGLSRYTSPADEVAYFDLLTGLDHEALNRVEHAGLSPDYFRAFSRGLQAARVYDQAIVAHLGPMHRPDLAAEMADLLIRLESARAVLCLAEYGEVLHLSLRTSLLNHDAESIIQPVVVGLGKAGGHGTMAGGQVTLTGHNADPLVSEITRRFLDIMGETDEGVPLLAE